MATDNIRYFDLLKEAVVARLRESHPGVSGDITEWKGQTIFLFQDDLLEKVNDQVSEKWFYTHMKGRSRKLPRVDILNLLSRYVGCENWEDFKFRHQGRAGSDLTERPNMVFLKIPAIVLAVMALIFATYKIMSNRDYQFCFVSFDDSTIIPLNTHVEILQDNESPLILNADSNGCVNLKTSEINVRFVVRSPYYKTDTVVRTLKKFSNSETVRLETDDYAMMLHYFSTNNTPDWNKRRRQLNMMFSDSARIYEVHRQAMIGAELYNKSEFINKLLVPTATLGRMRIIDMQYKGEKIVSLRFTHEN